jgi:RNA ligase
MTKLFDLFDDRSFYMMVENGYVKAQQSPDALYTIYNYTDACTWDQAWNEVTLQCRGLIVDETTDEIIARGMPKFFNSDQDQAPTFLLDDEVIVSDKMDGSLGILYYLPDYTEAIATRGSFTSDQAVWATNWWRTNRPDIALEAGKTYLFEIIYPENRIVVDYGGKEGLVWLGTVDNETGKFEPGWSLPIDSASRYNYKTWGEVLSAPERANAEGFVVTRISDGEMVKIKYEDYKRLHKYMTRVTERHVWECLLQDRRLIDEFAGAPDEFHHWVLEVAKDLEEKFATRHISLILNYRSIRFGKDEAKFEVEDPREAKKNFALAVKDEKDKSYFFSFFEERTVIPQIWKELKPEAKTFKVVNSDAD